MKNLLFLILFLPCILSGQTWPVLYGDGTPTSTPTSAGTRIYINRLTNDLYTYSLTCSCWILKGQGIDQITGTIAPLYTPGIGQSQFAINNASPPELYRHIGGGTWQCVNCMPDAGGDLAGDLADITVEAIQNIPVSTDDPVLGEVMKYDGANWAPGKDSAGLTIPQIIDSLAAAAGGYFKADTFMMAGNHTWTKPSWAKNHFVVVIGAGGGGASGALTAAGTGARTGAGGGSGGRSERMFASDLISNTVVVRVASGGTGGAGVSVINANGIAGNPGEAAGSYFGSYLVAKSGAGGSTSGTGGTGGNAATFLGSGGGNGNSIGLAGNSASQNPYTSTGGSGGGGVNGSEVVSAGAATTLPGTNSMYLFSMTSPGGTAGTSGAGGAGGNSVANFSIFIATGGGGGGGSAVAAAGKGGDAFYFGAGGGGGGSSRIQSGAGGRGGDGFVVVYSFGAGVDLNYTAEIDSVVAYDGEDGVDVTGNVISLDKPFVGSLVDSLELGEIEPYSGRFIAAKKNNVPLVVGFAGDSQFDQYQRNVQNFLSNEWGSTFKPNGPGYCAASDQATNVQGFGFNTVTYTGSWTKPNVITNTPPIVEEGLNGRYSEISGAGTVTFATAARTEWIDVEKFQNVKIYTKANGAAFTYSIDGGGSVSVTTLTHGGVNVTTITGLANTAHSLVITRTSGTLRVYGVSGYNTNAGNLTIHRFAQGSSSFESWGNRMSDTSYMSKMRTLFPVPQVVFFNLGSNDYLDAGNLDSLKKHVTRFITKFKLYMPNTDLVLVTPLDQPNTPPIDMRTYRDAIKQIAKGFQNVKVCNLYDVFGDYPTATRNGLLEADSVHWSALGAKLASPFLLNALIPSSTSAADLSDKSVGTIYYVEKKFSGLANASNAGYVTQLARALRGSQRQPWPDPWSAKRQAAIDIAAGVITSALIYVGPGQVYSYGDSLAANNGSTDFAGTNTSVDYMVSSATAANANLYGSNINYFFGTGSQVHNLCKKYQIVLFALGTGSTDLNFSVSGEGEFYSYYGECQSPSYDNLLFSVDNAKANIVFKFSKIGQAQWMVFLMTKARSIVIKGDEVRTAGNVFLYTNNTTTLDSLNVYVEINNVFNGDTYWGSYCDFWYFYILKNRGPLTFVSKIGNFYSKESGPIVYTNEKNNFHKYFLEYGNITHFIGSQGYHNPANDCMFNFSDALGSATTEISNKIVVKIGTMISDFTALNYGWNKAAATAYDNSLLFDCGNCQVRNPAYPALLISADTVRKDRNNCIIRGNYSAAGYALQFTGGGHTLIEAALYGRNSNGAVFLNGIANTLMLRGNIVASGTNSIYATAAHTVKVIGSPPTNKAVNGNVTQTISAYSVDSSVGW